MSKKINYREHLGKDVELYKNDKLFTKGRLNYVFKNDYTIVLNMTINNKRIPVEVDISRDEYKLKSQE